MKLLKFTLLIAFFGAISNVQSTFAALEPKNSVGNYAQTGVPELKGLTPEMQKMAISKFLELTPAKIKAMTGKKLGFVKTLELKMAQKYLKKQQAKGGDSVPKGLYILAVILGWGFLVMGIMDDWSGNDWWTNLLLTMLCWLPGVIHGLIKMGKYY